jgi:hypothetical protein
MQLAYLQRNDTSPECIVALDEYAWLMADPSPTFADRPRLDVASAPLHLWYGVFLAQPDMIADQAVAALRSLQGHWLRSLHAGTAEWLAVQALHIDAPMTTGHAVRVPFAALVQAPVALVEVLHDPLCAVLASPVEETGADPLLSVFSRSGLVAFLAAELPTAPLTRDQWATHIDRPRLQRTADRIR